MKQKGDVIKRACCISLVLFSILGLTVFVGCGSGGGGGSGSGGGGGGPGPAAPTSFITTSLFPLTSSWQTDNWTLFVDSSDHDFFNIPTRVMADTREPRLLYWTNDQDGLRLHGFMNEEGERVVFSPALLVANPICRILDQHSGTFFAGPDELNYYIECLGVEDVTVPAGTFANCMKIRVMIYPVGDLPTNYGYETLWFADNVGFVRAEADDNNFSELFLDAGDTRELLSYHITDVDGLSDDEKALREFGSRFQEYYMAEDLNSLMALISEDIIYKCVTKDAIRSNLEGLFNNFSDILVIWSTEDIQFDGDKATTFREALTIRRNDNNGDMEWLWNRESRVYKEEIDGWKWYGDHLGFRPDYLAVMLRNTAEGGAYNPMEAAFLKCGSNEYIDDPPDAIASLTVTGPPGSDIDNLDLKPSWEVDGSWQGFWDGVSLLKAVSGFYTFRVEEPDGDFFKFTDYLDPTHRLAVAVHVAPADGAQGVISGTLSWEPVDLARAYRVDWQSRPAGGTDWNYMDNQYTDATQVTVPLAPDTEYIWRVRARIFDVFGELDSESRSEYTWFTTVP